jgi:hypothetical protein
MRAVLLGEALSFYSLIPEVGIYTHAQGKTEAGKAN